MADGTDVATLLASLGGGQPASDTSMTAEQLQNLRNYGTQALGSQLPSTIYSPWQGVSYLLDKLNGRSALDNAASINKQQILGALGNQSLPGSSFGGGGQSQPSMDQSQAQAQPTQAQPAPLQQATTPQQTKVGSIPDQVPVGASPIATSSTGGDVAKIVIQDDKGQQSELTPEQMGGPPPPGYKIIATIDSKGDEHPVGSTTAAPSQVPTQVAQAGPTPGQQAPAAPVSNQPQGGQQGQQSGATVGQPIQTPYGTLPPQKPPLTAQQMYQLSQLPENVQKQYLQNREDAWQAKTVDTGFGTQWSLPPNEVHPNGISGFYAQPKVSTLKTAGGEVPIVTERDQQGGFKNQLLVPGAGSGGASNGNGLGQLSDITHKLATIGADAEATKASAVEGAKGVVKINQDALGKVASTLPDLNTQKQQIAELKQLEDLPETSKITTGPFAELAQKWRTNANNFFPGLVDPKSLAAADTYGKLSTNFAQGLAKDLTNRPTQFDFSTELTKAVPNFSTSPESRKAVLSMYDLKNQEGIAKAGIAQDVLQKGGNLQDFNTQMNQWYDNHQPTIEVNGKQIKFVGKHIAADDPSVLNETQQGGQSGISKHNEGDTATGPNGQKATFKNGKWQING